MVFRISAEFHVSDVSGYNFMSIALSNIEYLVDLVYVQTRGFQTQRVYKSITHRKSSGCRVPRPVAEPRCAARHRAVMTPRVVSNNHSRANGFQTFEGMVYNYHAFLAKLAMLSYAFTVSMPSTARISEYELSIARRYLGSAGSGGWLTPSYYFRSWWLGKARSATEARAGVLMWARQETYYDEEPGAVETTPPITLIF